MDSCQASLSPLGSRLSGHPMFHLKGLCLVEVELCKTCCICSLFCSNYKATNNIITIFLFFLAVLPAGTVVMAWSAAVAPADTVPLSHDRHLHRPDPYLWLPSPPFWRPHRLHPRRAHCILGGTFENHCCLNSLEKAVISGFTRFVSL